MLGGCTRPGRLAWAAAETNSRLTGQPTWSYRALDLIGRRVPLPRACRPVPSLQRVRPSSRAYREMGLSHEAGKDTGGLVLTPVRSICTAKSPSNWRGS